MMDQAPPSVPALRALYVPLVGREAEMDRLLAAASAVSHGSGQRIVTVLSGAGLGKSRMIQELVKRSPLRTYRAGAVGDRAAHGVVSRLLRSRFGLAEGMDEEAAKGQLRAQIAAVLEDRKVGDVCYFLGQLLGLVFHESPLTRAVADDPLQGRLLRRTLLKSFIESDAAREPLCLALDDLHRADEDSIELLRYLMEHVHAPVLILCTARPELLEGHEDWFSFGADHHERVELSALGSEQSVQVARALLSPCEGGPPAPLVEAAVRAAQGNPGLLRQMVRLCHDSGVLTESARPGLEPVWRVDLNRLMHVSLPVTAEDAVAARIEALRDGERRLLQHAAAQGSVFWLGALLALARSELAPPERWDPNDASDQSRIEAMLADLVARDHLLELPDSAFAGEREFVFKHHLEREKLARETSARDARRYHQVIADWLRGRDGSSSHEETTAMLAMHLERAAALLPAALCYLDAGDLARAGYAPKKAAEHYAKGLALLEDGDARRRIDALHNFGDVSCLLGRIDEALSMFREMLRLAHRFNLASKGGAAENRIGRLYRDTGNLTAALTHLETARALFTVTGDQRGISACYDDIGKLLWMKGQYDDALRELKVALEMRKVLGDRRSIALSLNNIGLVWLDHGRTELAAEALEAALKIRREINDPLGIVQSLETLGRLSREVGDHQRALSRFREAHAVAREIGEQNRIAVVLTHIGETHYRLGDAAEAVRILVQAEELCDEMGDKLHLAEAKRGLAKAYLIQNELRKARDAIKHAVDLFGQVRSKPHLAAALRTLGEITAAGAWGGAHEGKAIDYFMRSVALCKEIGNELEVAKSYRAFANYVQSSNHYKHNVDIQREAATLGQMAEEIFERHRRAAAKAEAVDVSES